MKVGIVGYGSIGARHAANAAFLGHEVLVYDPLVRRDVKFERNIYETCEAVVIATPTIYHPSGIRACAVHGKHMLIEKPMARMVGDLPELLGLAATNKATVMMGNNLRFHPGVQQAKAWIEAGDIGNPIWASFICAAKSIHPAYLGDGVILNTGAHEVDMAMHLLGPVTEVVSASSTSVDDIEDIADFVLLHQSGARSSFHLDFVTPREIREAWIVGDEDRVGVELRNRNSSLGSRSIAHAGSFDHDYVLEMKAFVERTEGNEANAGATGADGLACLQVLLDVRRKAGLE